MCPPPSLAAYSCRLPSIAGPAVDCGADGSCEFDGSSVCGGGDGDGDCEHLT